MYCNRDHSSNGISDFVEKMNIQLISNGPGLPSKEEEVRLKEVHEKFRDRLKIPRR